jgi:ribonucleoside-diphosphate reductase alpha chain
MNKVIGPQTLEAQEIGRLKYQQAGESFREAMNRIAAGLKDNDEHYHNLRDIFLHQRFLPGGRIQTAIGAGKEVTPYNCFVSGTIEDSFVDGDGSIMERAKQAAATMRMGGGIGYDFSTLRPKGDLIRKLQSHSSGPISFMNIFNAVCEATSSSGHRRGAQMGVLRVDHPDIEEFIRAKQNAHAWRGFNISIAITDEFMEAVLYDRPFSLRWGGDHRREIDAGDLWEKIMRSTWDYAEPGVIFIDTVNRKNNLFYCETISATNPCGEQPLPPFGACLLGSFNLAKYLRSNFPGQGDGAAYYFDKDSLINDIPAVVRAMDNVVDRARYPLPQQRDEAVTKRRMGIGPTALANAIEACGYLYGTPAFVDMESELLGTINRHCYLASIELAKEKGTFPLYNETFYPNGEFIGSLDDDVQELIRKHGIRNSHLTSIAPTGTISQYADNVSSGLEPVFAHRLNRNVNTPDGPKAMEIVDYGVRFLNVYGKQSGEVTADEHVQVLIAAQQHIDSAVSKTCNVNGKMPWADFKSIYMQAWEGGAKGCTTFNQDGQREALLVAAPTKDMEQGLVCKIDPETGRRECE